MLSIVWRRWFGVHGRLLVWLNRQLLKGLSSLLTMPSASEVVAVHDVVMSCASDLVAVEDQVKNLGLQALCVDV